MLALRSAQRLARPRARMLSTMVEKVQADITRIKAAAAGSDASSYSVAELEKDMAAGTVDVSKLQDSLSFNVVAQKMVSKMNADMNAAKIAGEGPTIDFNAWSSKVETPGLVDAIKAMYEKELSAPDFEKALAAELADTQAKLAETFGGPEGLYAKAKAEEKAADAGLLQCVADLELLEKQIDGVSEQTIADILEMEPELRKEVEEEIDNANWAP
mmetsp:Transcript_92948/g.278828  ORF Transcript_92948/g.278828 Transcript_92948/m.278828 type:complete len:215 (-) Transcript_92948:372-1016(-)